MEHHETSIVSLFSADMSLGEILKGQKKRSGDCLRGADPRRHREGVLSAVDRDADVHEEVGQGLRSPKVFLRSP